MYEAPRNEIKIEDHRPRCPHYRPWKKSTIFLTFQFSMTLDIIITWYIRHLEEKMEENL